MNFDKIKKAMIRTDQNPELIKKAVKRMTADQGPALVVAAFQSSI